MKTLVAPMPCAALVCVGVLTSCGEPAGLPGDTVIVAVDERGGSGALADGTGIEVPPGAVTHAVEIAISRAVESGTLPLDAQAVGSTYLFRPEGMLFARPVAVTLAFDRGRLPEGVTSSDVVASSAPASSGTFSDLPTELADASHVRAYTTGFSLFVAAISPCKGSGSAGRSCDDRNPCTFDDICVSRGACAGTPYTCSDGNLCTDDRCDGAGGCTFANNSAPCQDGDLCTFGDTCGGGACNRGTAYACNDGNVCTDDACNGAGGCTFVPNTAPCDDGNPCTFGDRCSGGACGGTAYGCDDGDACTADACDGAGGCTHTPAPGCGPPRAPTLINARPIDGSYVEITWADDATDEDGFRVERSRDAGSTWVVVRTLDPNATYTQDYAVANEQEVCYRVFAFNARGDSPPSGTRCTAPPAAPTGLTAAVVGAGIDLTWTDNSAVEDGYEVQRTDGVVAWGVVARLPANSASYRDVVTSDVTYRYIVRATRDGGGSRNSNIASAAVATVAPSAPGGVQAIPWGSTAVGITWTDGSTNEAGFRVERSPDGAGSWVTVGTSWFAAYYPDQFVDGGRISEVPVCYRVIAYNDVGDSAPSDPDCTTPPAGPTNLTATSMAEGVLLTWTDNSGVEDGYYVVLITDCREQPDYWIDLPANSTSYLDTSGPWCFGPALAYYVIATKDGGWSDYSNEATAAAPP